MRRFFRVAMTNGPDWLVMLLIIAGLFMILHGLCPL